MAAKVSKFQKSTIFLLFFLVAEVGDAQIWPNAFCELLDPTDKLKLGLRCALRTKDHCPHPNNSAYKQ